MKAKDSIVETNFGFVQATISEALSREDLKKGLEEFIKNIKL